ncbi:MAG: hypothetical protein ACYC6Y_00445 [Thermoguttaceae bacterium]
MAAFFAWSCRLLILAAMSSWLLEAPYREDELRPADGRFRLASIPALPAPNLPNSGNRDDPREGVDLPGSVLPGSVVPSALLPLLKLLPRPGPTERPPDGFAPRLVVLPLSRFLVTLGEGLLKFGVRLLKLGGETLELGEADRPGSVVRDELPMPALPPPKLGEDVLKPGEAENPPPAPPRDVPISPREVPIPPRDVPLPPPSPRSNDPPPEENELPRDSPRSERWAWTGLWSRIPATVTATIGSIFGAILKPYCMGPSLRILAGQPTRRSGATLRKDLQVRVTFTQSPYRETSRPMP